jgi:hypothetical protein
MIRHSSITDKESVYSIHTICWVVTRTAVSCDVRAELTGLRCSLV